MEPRRRHRWDRRGAATVLAAAALILALGTPPAGAQSDGPPSGAPTTAPTSTVPTSTVPTSTVPTSSAPTAGPTTQPGGVAATDAQLAQARSELDAASLDAMVAARRAEVVAQVRGELDGALAAEAAARATLDATGASLDVARDRSREREASLGAARAEVEQWRRRCVALAVAAYQRLGTRHDDAAATLVGGWHDERQVRSNYTEAAARQLDEALTAARGRERDAAVDLERAQALVGEVDGRMAAARGEVDRAAGQVAAARDRVARAERGELDTLGTLSGSTALQSGGPTILGPSLLDATDLARFARQRGGVHPSLNIDELARYYIEEGVAEGVRGDIAFAQSILETGNFSFRNSMVAPTDFNFAGIGACDSCSRGTGFDSARLGVRAQMQHLRAYADPTLTSDRYANPAVATRPETLHVRGCCWLWSDLTGVWATDRTYHHKILAIYNSMLTSALAVRHGG